MKMTLTNEWRGNPPGTIIDATPGQRTMIETLGYGVPWTKPSVNNTPLEDAMPELDAALETIPSPVKPKGKK